MEPQNEICYNYSWGEFYETMRACNGFEETRDKFAIFEALDRATTLEDIQNTINLASAKPSLLTEEKINWFNSPCLDGILFSLKGVEVEEKLYEKEYVKYYLNERLYEKEFVETCKYYWSKKILTPNIYKIVKMGFVNLLKLILENQKTKLSLQQLVDLSWKAGICGQLNIIKLIYEYEPKAIRWGFSDIIYYSCNNNYPEIIRFLFDTFPPAGQEIHDFNSSYRLRKVIYKNNIEIANLLLARGYRDPYSIREANSVEMVELLIKYKVINFDHINEALSRACSLGNTDLAKRLLDLGANNGQNCFIDTCIYGYVEIVKLLLDYGAYLHAHDELPFRLAASRGHTEIVKLLMERGANTKKWGTQALLDALYRKHGKTVKFLLEKKVGNFAIRSFAAVKLFLFKKKMNL